VRERLHKLLAHAGVASRREAERLIGLGRVRVNGEVVAQPGTLASLEDDVVEVDGLRVASREGFEHYLLNKPPGVVSTARDPQHRPTVVGLLRGVTARVYPVGRLDAASEGLILLTNDGDLAQRLTHPRFGLEKEYVVELSQPVEEAELDRIRRGVESRGERLRPREARLEGSGRSNRAVIILAEGKKHEVRRMFEAVGRHVTRLQRVRLGPLLLGDLPSGQYRRLSKAEVEQLRAATLG